MSRSGRWAVPLIAAFLCTGCTPDLIADLIVENVDVNWSAPNRSAEATITNVGNQDMFLSAMYWLLEQEELIGIGPKPVESIRLSLTANELHNIFWFSFLVMPLACAMMGGGMWWIRRT